ncbi:hypothetical protein BHM03_00017582 [Ensete ventricosum]|nr:hypothetical protein BHM03_00017582 [Ensete ventricosum]
MPHVNFLPLLILAVAISRITYKRDTPRHCFCVLDAVDLIEAVKDWSHRAAVGNLENVDFAGRVQCRIFVSHYSNREEFNVAVSDILQLSEKGRAGGRKFKWLRGLLTAAEAGSAAVGDNKKTVESSIKNRGKQQRVRSSTALVLVSTSGGRERWTSVRDRSVKEEQQIWFGIARLDAQAVAEAGLSWPRLSSGRIMRYGCRRGELGIAIIDLEVIGAFAAFHRFSPLAAVVDPL